MISILTLFFKSNSSESITQIFLTLYFKKFERAEVNDKRNTLS